MKFSPAIGTQLFALLVFTSDVTALFGLEKILPRGRCNNGLPGDWQWAPKRFFGFARGECHCPSPTHFASNNHCYPIAEYDALPECAADLNNWCSILNREEPVGCKGPLNCDKIHGLEIPGNFFPCTPDNSLRHCSRFHSCVHEKSGFAPGECTAAITCRGEVICRSLKLASDGLSIIMEDAKTKEDGEL